MEKQNVGQVSLPSNPRLAGAAERAIWDSEVTAEPGMCQRFVRQVVQKVYGRKYDRYHKESAERSRQAWAGSGFAVDPKRGSLVGDLLYKKATDGNQYGHVGIRVAGNRVAENSTTKKGRKSGAKGYRSLEEFGKVDLIVRLPME